MRKVAWIFSEAIRIPVAGKSFIVFSPINHFNLQRINMKLPFNKVRPQGLGLLVLPPQQELAFQKLSSPQEAPIE